MGLAIEGRDSRLSLAAPLNPQAHRSLPASGRVLKGHVASVKFTDFLEISGHSANTRNSVSARETDARRGIKTDHFASQFPSTYDFGALRAFAMSPQLRLNRAGIAQN
ncbi:MAG: hypothetical protein F4Z80_00115 [Chloroflexi bacterium]|nr:hypothetical protein [Chloroflexota bacterium]